MRKLTTLILMLACSTAWAADPPKPKAEALQFTITTDGSKLVLTPVNPAKIRLSTATANNGAGMAAVVVNGLPELADFAVVVTINGQPGPEPKPDPKPEPKPDPNPSPTPQKLFAVLVEETAVRGKLPFDQVNAILSPKVRDHMKAKSYEYRVVDKDVKDKDGKVPKEIESFLAQAAGKPLPRIVIANEKGELLYNDMVPANEELLMGLMTKWGGK